MGYASLPLRSHVYPFSKPLHLLRLLDLYLPLLPVPLLGCCQLVPYRPKRCAPFSLVPVFPLLPTLLRLVQIDNTVVKGNTDTVRPTEIDQPVSVRNHNAFAAEHMPDLGYDIKDFQVYTWRLAKWTQLDNKLAGDKFECGGHKWNILLFPSGGNARAPPKETVSVYLNYAEPTRAPEGWHVCVQFALAISNTRDPTVYIVSQARHRFIAEESDWGFTRFSERQKLFEPQDEHTRPIIEEDSVDITVYVRVLEDPTGVLWHNFVNYDSKKETGFVGLKNQGATGYMNTLLQSFYCTNFLRRAIYEIPTEDDVPTESTALALQRIFYALQTSDQPVGTTELTKSFGWKSLDSFLQHDVVEFKRVLQDKLQSRMKGTKAEGVITKLFVGKLKSYIKCLNVAYESVRAEEFSDLELNVQGLRNLYESFKDYVAVTMLDGEKKYLAEGYGLQDAKMGVIFESFPPVLHLRLKRYEYDVQRSSMVKLNDRHEFPFEIDLDEFLDSTADRSQPWVYKLHGVVVHSGDINQGRYFAVLKPDHNTRWLKFDDDRVTPVTAKEVLEDNYGGEALGTVQRGLVQPEKRSTNAYLLIYIRESAMDEVLAPFTDADTPAHLKRRLDEERLQLEAKKREREEQHLFLTAKVITDETFSCHEGFDMATFDERSWPPSELPSFRMLKQRTFSSFKGEVAQYFNYPESRIRLWVLVNRQNKTARLDTPIPENEPALTVEVIRNNMAARQHDLRLYLDIISVSDTTKPYPPPRSIMVFLKHFDVAKQTLLGAGKIFMLRTSKVSELAHVINERMRWVPSTPLRFYEEIKPGMVEPMKPKLSFAQCEIQDGDIICFQVDISEKEAHDFESQGLHSNPIPFYDYLQNRVMIEFRPQSGKDHDNPEFSLVLTKKQNYDIMSRKVGEYLRHDPIKLRFTTTHATTGMANAVLKRSLNQTIAEIMPPSYINPTTTRILYEKLDVSIVELETKRF
ncbi:ubiquitin carboxyl-terminal hydrolase 5 [Mycena galopus ATCC 62051]|nr:ubiquitin carboxyl-terminal hydrolase 5 [Mycena galopus ATCC 62051]